MRYTGVWGLAGAVVLLVTGCPAFLPQQAPQDPGGASAIEWEPCHDGGGREEAPEDGDPEWTAALECGTLSVPLDHDDPDGETIDIALARVPASGGPDERIGSLVLNPGGPGESGVEMLAYPQFSDGIRSAFDLVAFDPRGVGDSGGFACGNWDRFAEAQLRVQDPTAVTDAELERLTSSARSYADACTETVGAGFLAEIGTVNVVRDLDLIREALGDDALSYVGYSYGTYIGALYAEMFPATTRALVLDGAVETERPNLEVAEDQAAAFQETWELFVADCSAAGTCPFSGPEAADAEMTRILDRLDAEPATARDMPVDGPTLLGMVGLALYDETSWPELARTLTALAEGSAESGELLDALYDTTYGVGEEEEDVAAAGEEPEGDPYADTEAALTAVNCADRVDPTDPEAYREAAEAIAAETPFFGPDLVWGQLPCAYWTDTETAPTGFAAADAPPLVVVGTVGDPATPYGWARELAGQLETATLVTYEGSGHTVYGYGLPCVDNPIDAYLLTGRAPEPGLSCPAF